MIEISARCVLLDIEGTTSSIKSVHDEMFPFARKKLPTFLVANWDTPQVAECLELLASDLSFPSVANWLGEQDASSRESSIEKVVTDVGLMMDRDMKATGLKQLQGLIWKDGFHIGDLVAHLYPDTAPAIRSWVDAGLDVRIYSSGSVGAQKLFFGHTVDGDLLSLFSGHYDTTSGPKKETASYITISQSCGFEPGEIVFLSDVPDELDAARTAGMQTVLSIRPGNAPVDETDHTAITSFAELAITPGNQ